MKNIDIELIKEESFVEEWVTDMFFDISNKIVEIETDGASIEPGVYLSKALIKVSKWLSLTGTSFDYETKETKSIKNIEHVRLSSIVRLIINDNEIKIDGFAVSLGWVEIILTGAEIEVTGEYKD